MTGRIHRFDFGALRDFRGPIVINTAHDLHAVEAEPPPPPPPAFNEQELNAARMAAKREGYHEGFAAGKLEAQNEADQKLADANEVIAKLGGMLTALTYSYQQMLVQESENLARMITTIAHKVAGDAMEKRGEMAIFSMVEQCLPVLLSKPKLVIDLHPDIFERALERIETTLQASGAEAEIQFRANPEIGISDIHLDWGAGKVSRDASALWQEIDSLIARVPLEVSVDAPAQEITTETNNNTEANQ